VRAEEAREAKGRICTQKSRPCTFVLRLHGEQELVAMSEAREPMSKVRKTFKVSWYRCPIPTERLKEITRRSDLQGAIQAVGFLVIIGALGAVTWWLFARELWVWTAVAPQA
jgi:hypothetical protein